MNLPSRANSFHRKGRQITTLDIFSEVAKQQRDAKSIFSKPIKAVNYQSGQMKLKRKKVWGESKKRKFLFW